MATKKWWPAPHAQSFLDATVSLPGSKSQTIRALVLGAAGTKPLRIEGALKSRDTELALAALRHLGADFTDGIFTPAVQRNYSGTIDCGLAGTVMRFIPALVAFGAGTVRFEGDPQALGRPVGPLLEALTQLGASVKYHGRPGYLPFSLTGRISTSPSGEEIAAPLPIEVSLDSSASSQFLSALLLAAPAASEAFQIRVTGKVPSAPHLQMTMQMLEDQGAPARRLTPETWLTSNAPLAANPITIEPDLSNAGPFLAAALIAGGTVRVSDWPSETTQAGDAWKWLLPLFGAEVSLHDSTLQVTCDHPRSWPGVNLNLSQVGELVPTIAALCVFADSPSELTGIGHLRGHETDRLEALATEIRRAGAGATVMPEGLRIEPTGTLHPARFHSYADHRMATFAALLGLALPGSEVSDIATTAKTLPDFAMRWEAMLNGETLPLGGTLDE